VLEADNDDPDAGDDAVAGDVEGEEN
jgi:hypothetical protein